MVSNSSAEFLTLISEDFCLQRGHALPFGATVERDGINFSIYTRNATGVALVLFLPGEEKEIAAFPLDNKINRTGDVWHVFIGGLNPGIKYAYKIDGPQALPHLYDASLFLADPYAIAINGRVNWANAEQPTSFFRKTAIVNKEYNWGLDQPINRPLADSVIYELHVRSFTQDKSSNVKNPGTFLGVIEKITYLVELGVTAIELLPVTEFDELDNDRTNPETGEALRNLWGYHPLSFFAVKSGLLENFRDLQDTVFSLEGQVVSRCWFLWFFSVPNDYHL